MFFQSPSPISLGFGFIREGNKGFEGGNPWRQKGGFSWLQKGKTLWVETPNGKSLLGKSILSLVEEEDLKIRNEFHLHFSPIFLLFVIVYGCISPLTS